MYIVKYSELVHMVEMHSQARASSQYELVCLHFLARASTVSIFFLPLFVLEMKYMDVCSSELSLL